MQVVPEGLGSFRLPHASTYILVGGLGGIGRSIARVLTERGAKHLVFLSRSGSSHPEARSLLEEFQHQGVLATAISVDVAQKSQLEAVINKIKQHFPPIKGVIHCAMDLRVSYIGENERILIQSDGAAPGWHLQQHVGEGLEFVTSPEIAGDPELA